MCMIKSMDRVVLWHKTFRYDVEATFICTEMEILEKYTELQGCREHPLLQTCMLKLQLHYNVMSNEYEDIINVFVLIGT